MALRVRAAKSGTRILLWAGRVELVDVHHAAVREHDHRPRVGRKTGLRQRQLMACGETRGTRATDGAGNADGAERHWAATLALQSSHCQRQQLAKIRYFVWRVV